MSVVIPLDPLPEPLELLERFAHHPFPALLDGAADHPDLGRYSYLTADPIAVLQGPASAWPAHRDRIRSLLDRGQPRRPELPPFQGGWVGWFGYELGAAFDRMPHAAHDPLGHADLSLACHDWVIAWDHLAGRAWLVSTGLDADGRRDHGRAERRAAEVMATISGTTPTGEGSYRAGPAISDFTAEAYRGAVTTVIGRVLDGEIFQANLAQRFTAPFAGSALSFYRQLRRRSAAPLAAFLDHGSVQVASASPELFLRLDAVSGHIETRPIKGTRPRGADPADDARLAAELETSEKDRAENVMIVDLLRNDLARVATPGSVAVPSLCRLESHPTVHHLVSTVTGTLRPARDALDLLAATFPGGSVTGAPKLRALSLIAELEPVTRGVYCGAIGWLGLDGSMALSVAIRTVTIAGGVASFHAGGGITALSEPDAEFQETLDKAAAIRAALAEGG